MASLKLKVEEREQLFYRKYAYRATCRVKGAHYTNNITSIDEYRDKIDQLQSDLRRYPLYIPSGLDDLDYLALDDLIRYILRFEKNDKGTLRREGNNISFFSNDLDFLKKAPSTMSPLKITQVSLMPSGVKYFKRTVPAPYRIYMKDARVPASLKSEIISFIEKNVGVEFSSAFGMWLHRPNRWDQVWCSKTFYINYTEPSQLTMMHLLFPEVIGKNYKLEQK